MNMFTGGSATPEQFGFTDSATAINPADVLTASDVVSSPYQSDSTGTYWRVQESTDGGSTWTALDTNTLYNPSDLASLNQAQVNLTSNSAGLSRTLEFNGIQVQIDGDGISSGTNPNGETFAVQLDPNAASDMATTITDPNQVAASSDTWNINSSNNSVVFNATINGVNSGPITAVIPSGTYTNDPGQSDDISAALTSAIQTAYQTATGSALPDTLNVAFNPHTKQFKIMMPSGGGSDILNFEWSSNSASTANQIFGFRNDATVAVGSSSASDNPASVEANAAQGLPGDNTNATNIANLANGTMFAGTTPTDMYMSLVSSIGVDASSGNTNQQYHTTLMNELTQQQQQMSGVSMDEEAANLVVYQQSYQAAAQLITSANQMLTTLLQMVNPNA
jgi:flagellar hook-associated protein FlgK